jgi:zinc-RING finger domain
MIFNSPAISNNALHQQHQDEAHSGAPDKRNEDNFQMNNANLDARFSCNICFDAVIEPVVTQCGHLYCWPCLYKWLEPGMYPADRVRLSLNPLLSTPPDTSRQVCPVCKAGCSVNTIVPIYVRSAETELISSADKGDGGVSKLNRQQNQQLEISSLDLDVGETTDGESITSVPSTEDLPAPYATGLRQRRTSTIDSQTSISSDVPRRPAPQSPPHHPSSVHQSSSLSPNRPPTTSSSLLGSVPLSPMNLSISSLNNHTSRRSSSALLQGGILTPFVHDAIRTASSRSSDVPSIHRPEGSNFPYSTTATDSLIESDPGATELLSRVLLMLGSFVIMCLLLF